MQQESLALICYIDNAQYNPTTLKGMALLQQYIDAHMHLCSCASSKLSCYWDFGNAPVALLRDL